MSTREFLAAYYVLMSNAYVAAMMSRRYRSRQPRRWWVRDILQERERLGATNTLVSEMLLSDNESFRNFTRMTKEQFENLLRMVSPHLQKNSIRKPISEKERLLITLRFFVTGATYASLWYQFRVGKATVCNIVRETTEVIWDVLHEEYIKSPTEEDLKETAALFYEKTGLPNCIGSIDGKHCVIKAPANSGTLYRNYKHAFSIVLLAVCDANYLFTYVNIGAYGSESDGGILRRSTFGINLLNNQLDLPEDTFLPNSDVKFPYFFVGDEAFPLKKHLMRPYGGRNLSQDKLLFNKRLSSARRYIECTFGILASKFRIYHTLICTEERVAQSIIKSTVVLHNFIRKTGGNMTVAEEFSNDAIDVGNWERRRDTRSNNSAREPLMLRDRLKDYMTEQSVLHSSEVE